MALLQVSGSIIATGDARMLAPCAQPMWCDGAKKPISFPDSPLCMSAEVGNQCMTLDKPRVLTMEEASYLKHDVDHGMQVVYCFKYTVGGNDGIKVLNAGIMLLQHLSTHNHYAHLWAVAAIMKDKMGEFGATVACKQAAQATQLFLLHDGMLAAHNARAVLPCSALLLRLLHLNNLEES